MGVQKPTASAKRLSSIALAPRERSHATDLSHRAEVEAAVDLPYPGNVQPPAVDLSRVALGNRRRPGFQRRRPSKAPKI